MGLYFLSTCFPVSEAKRSNDFLGVDPWWWLKSLRCSSAEKGGQSTRPEGCGVRGRRNKSQRDGEQGFIGPRNETTLSKGRTRVLGPKDLEFEREGIKAQGLESEGPHRSQEWRHRSVKAEPVFWAQRTQSLRDEKPHSWKLPEVIVGKSQPGGGDLTNLMHCWVEYPSEWVIGTGHSGSSCASGHLLPWMGGTTWRAWQSLSTNVILCRRGLGGRSQEAPWQTRDKRNLIWGVYWEKR